MRSDEESHVFIERREFDKKRCDNVIRYDIQGKFIKRAFHNISPMPQQVVRSNPLASLNLITRM